MNINKFLSYLFFPGITIHELAHATACVLLGVKIKKTKLFSFTDGYVVFDDSKSYNNILISIFPFFFNIAFAVLSAFLIKTGTSLLLTILLIWLSLSALFFCVPSKQDARNVFEAVKKTYTESQPIYMWLLKIILLPLTLLLLILSVFFWIFDNSFLFRVLLIALWFYLLVIIL